MIRGLSLLLLAGIAFTWIASCTKSHAADTSLAGLAGQWKLIYSTSPYLGRALSPPAGSILTLRGNYTYEITVQGVRKDAGTVRPASDNGTSKPDLLYFNEGEYFGQGRDGKNVYFFRRYGDTLDLGFQASANVTFFVTPMTHLIRQ
jgi:hypothetical protein